MILVDRALEQRHVTGHPIRVALVGAGFMGSGIALQIIQAVRGMELVAIANRHPDRAIKAYTQAGVDDVQTVDSVSALERAVARGRATVSDNPALLCEAGGIDVIIEVTGTVEFAATVALAAMENGKHVVLMNAELDGTVGPILKQRADSAGVIITNADGDQPGVIMNLYRFVNGIGVRPLLCGNIKGLHDPYRNPKTQGGFAKRWGQSPSMVTSFADGTKVSFEMAIVANATGMHVSRRGMHGPSVDPGTPIEEATQLFPLEGLGDGPGVVDYVVGARPSPGVFVVGAHDNPIQQHYLNLYKLGEGPLYCFFTPYHLCHFEVPNTVARAALFADAAVTPLGPPCVDVVATAKVDLRPGDVIDGCGGYKAYGLAENAAVTAANRFLPMGLAEGCTLRRAIPRDAVLTYDDVAIPSGRVADRLRREQDEYFGFVKSRGAIEHSPPEVSANNDP